MRRWSIWCFPVLMFVAALPVLSRWGGAAEEKAAAKAKADDSSKAKADDSAKAKADDSIDKDYSSELPRIPPTSPDDALKTFDVQPGFRLEQVAAEPLTTSPTALAWDENGRLFVNEMSGYSEDGDKPLGGVRLLEDTDGDGHYDKSVRYIEGIPWPTGVACYDGGIFVAAAPDILYCKDTDGDGRADEQRVVFTGFNRNNVQGLLNSLQWGLDNRVQGSASTLGGTLRSLDHPDAPVLNVNGRDFAIEPKSMTIAAVSGGGQHGMSYDRWGQKFVCGNSDHAVIVLYEDRYIARNPYLAAPPARKSIAADGNQADVFRISPLEPWRVVRTRLRMSGVVKGIVEGGGRAAGYFTGATGITIYRGDAFPPEYHGNLFVADCGSNLVHRKLLKPDGISQIADRADAGREFVASRDIWFRPVQHANAPDGTLYIADMCREVIEHPDSIPPFIKKHLDLTSGRDRGRIYRVVPEGFKQPKLPQLGKATAAELVATLDHTNGWHRDTALRLLYERQDSAAIEPLEKLSGGAKTPEGMIYALAALDGMKALRPETVLPLLADDQPRVREHAVRHAEKLAGDSPKLREKLYAMTDDKDLRVRYQLAFSLGEFDAPARYPALAALAKRDGADPYCRMAIFSSLAEGAGEMFKLLAADKEFRKMPAGIAFLEALAVQIGAQNRASDVAALLKALPAIPAAESSLSQAVLRGVTRGSGGKNPKLKEQLATATGGKSQALLDALLAEAKQTALDDKADEAARAEAVRSLGIAGFAATSETLAELVDPRQPQTVQLAALSTLGQFDDPGVAPVLLQSFGTLSPRLRSEALEAIFSRPARVKALLAAIEAGEFAAADVDPARAKLLTSHADAAIRKQAEKLFGAEKPTKRSEIIEAYRPALELKGDAERGKLTFRKICAACHRLDNFGHEIGMNLAAIRNRGPETILISVLDPNREVDPKYVNYLASTTDGRTFSGIIAAETATSVTLKRAENANDTILRIDLEELRGSGQSIMPEGLEKQLDKQALADVIAYLMSIK